MTKPIQETYTYHAGKKLLLKKRSDQMVVRALPDVLEKAGIHSLKRVSSASSRVSGIAHEKLDELMGRARSLAVTHHAYEVAGSEEDFLITDRIFVTFEPRATLELISALAGKYGLITKARYSDHEFLFQLTNATGMNPVKLIVKLTEDEPLVKRAEHDLNLLAKTQALPLPTDPYYNRQWHLHTDYTHNEFDPISSSRCQSAWQLMGGYGSADVVVGVTDDGCQLDHVDFDSDQKFSGWGYFQGDSFITNSAVGADPDEMYQQGSNHGTSVAGVIAAELDAQLTVGAAPGCKLFPVKWESDGPSLYISTGKLYTALRYLADKVDILSNSWGSTPSSYWPSYVTEYIESLAKDGGRRGKGIVFLWAAGNENCPISFESDIDVPYSDGWNNGVNGWYWSGVRTSRKFTNDLVGLDGVMHIAALASTGKRSHYSNYGSGISLTAPSSNSHSYYRLEVEGLGITTATGPSTDSSSPVTQSFGGTSSATPLVAGIAALVISANPSLSGKAVISLLKRTASKQLNMSGYPRTPAASYDPEPDWDVSPVAPFDQGSFQDIGSDEGSWSPWFGHGNVDALEAVQAAMGESKGTVETDDYLFGSSPNKKIPDENTTGIQDTIVVNKGGRLDHVQVTLDIIHTWVGDLEIRLIAPDGNSVLLHNRTGSNQKNLQQSYDFNNHAALVSLKGSEINGRWTLRVKDLAGQDVGKLKQWGLVFQVGVASVFKEDANSIKIPDNQLEGITKTIEIDTQIIIKKMSVSIDITHPWIGDLVVKLIAPTQDEFILHNRSGRSQDNLRQEWSVENYAEFGLLVGQEAKGKWWLNVSDHAGRDIGKLNRWSMTVSG